VKADTTPASIRHVWTHEGKKVAEVTLSIEGSPWRTYSSKKIDPTAKGAWAVEVRTDKAELIQAFQFRIQ
jgi:uncharacterized protein YpuA (DUF1002 family)